jgi:hypothetical protein
MQRKWSECKTQKDCNLYMAELMQERARRVRKRLLRGEIRKDMVAWAKRDLTGYYAEARDYLFAAMGGAE